MSVSTDLKKLVFDDTQVVYLVSGNTCSLGQVDSGMPIKGIYSKKCTGLDGTRQWNIEEVSLGILVNDKITSIKNVSSLSLVGGAYCLYVK